MPCNLTDSMDRWQFRIRTLRRMVRGWEANELAAQNKKKSELSKSFTRLKSLAEIRLLTDQQRADKKRVEDSLDQIWA